MKVPDGNYIVLSLFILVVSLMLGVMYGHDGLAAAVITLCSIWTLSDGIKIWQWWSNGQEPLPFMSTPIISCPKLPIFWYFGSIFLQLVALAMFAFGNPLMSSVCFWIFYAGASPVLHLKYYSGTSEENAFTMLPELIMALIIASMVMTMPLDSRTYNNLGKFGGLFVLEMAALTGVSVAYLALPMMGVQLPEVTAAEKLPLQRPGTAV